MTTPLPDYGISFPSNQDPTVVIQADKLAEQFIKQQVADPTYTHELVASQLWAVKKDNTFHLLSAHPDVYDLLESDFDLSDYNAVIIHTTGWAAPLSQDGSVEAPPSQHSQRRRVALAACVSDASVGSALSFADDPEIVLDPGSATGSLADALLTFWEKNRISL